MSLQYRKRDIDDGAIDKGHARPDDRCRKDPSSRPFVQRETAGAERMTASSQGDRQMWDIWCLLQLGLSGSLPPRFFITCTAKTARWFPFPPTPVPAPRAPVRYRFPWSCWTTTGARHNGRLRRSCPWPSRHGRGRASRTCRPSLRKRRCLSGPGPPPGIHRAVAAGSCSRCWEGVAPDGR